MNLAVNMCRLSRIKYLFILAAVGSLIIAVVCCTKWQNCPYLSGGSLLSSCTSECLTGFCFAQMTSHVLSSYPISVSFLPAVVSLNKCDFSGHMRSYFHVLNSQPPPILTYFLKFCETVLKHFTEISGNTLQSFNAFS